MVSSNGNKSYKKHQLKVAASAAIQCAFNQQKTSNKGIEYGHQKCAYVYLVLVVVFIIILCCLSAIKTLENRDKSKF